MKFNENLKYLRKEAKLTQEQLAEKLNVSRQAVTKWESGQSLPDIQNLKEMVDMFGVTMDALVGDIGTKKESVMNKKINDIGYFIFGIVILFLFVINSISETVGSITGDENKKIISYIILGIIGFLLMIFLLKAYLLNTNQIIINMKDNAEAQKDRKKYIFNKYKSYSIGNIVFSVIFNLQSYDAGFREFGINFLETFAIYSILTFFLAVINYRDLEKKVKELNKD